MRPVVNGSSQVARSPSPVGPKRDALGVAPLSRRAISLAMATAANVAADDGRQERADDHPGHQAAGPDGQVAGHAPGHAEAGEQAGPGEGHGPWVGGLDRGHQGLRAEGQDLVEDATDGWQQQEQADGPEGDHERERGAATGDRRPAHRGQADGDGRQHGQPDEQVERTARSVGDQDDAGGGRPGRGQGEGQESQLESSRPHDGSLATSVASVRSGVVPPTSTYPGARRKYRVGWDRRVIATLPLPFEHARTAPDHRGGGKDDRTHVTHGRIHAARFTGTRAIASPRFVGDAARGGLRGRTWLRGHGGVVALDESVGHGRSDAGGGPAGHPVHLSDAPHAGPGPG